MTATDSTYDEPADDQLAAALRVANIPTLLMVLFQLTGDEKWLSAPFRPTKARGLELHDDGGLSREVRDMVIAEATVAVRNWRSGTPAALPVPSRPQLKRMLECCFADVVGEEYLAMYTSQLGYTQDNGNIADAPTVTIADAFTVGIIGAGIGGLLAALRLRESGFTPIVFERQSGVGGVWRNNHYPGAGVDTPSHLYSFDFFPRDWRNFFARQPEVLGYLEEFASTTKLLEHVACNTDVVSARYDEPSRMWDIETRGPDGAAVTRVNAVISAVGLFSTPQIPDIPGLQAFSGPVFHSSAWPADLDVTGKRVAVIGTGASAMQIVPAIADAASAVTVYQRSPQWIAPVGYYFDDVDAGVHWLHENLPYYARWYRARMSWGYNDAVHPALRIDPSWAHPARSVNAINERLRVFFTDYLMTALEGRPDLQAKALPGYPPYGKRILLDNGWFAAIRKPNVELTTDSVVAVTADAVCDATGRSCAADIIVLSTGFHTQRYVSTLTIHGAQGAELRDVWDDDDPRAYLGITTPGFPNLFFTYGPATNAGGGSFVSLAESQVGYIVALLRAVRDSGAGAVDVRAEMCRDYNERLDAANAHMVWSHPGMSNYVRNGRGRIVVNMPWRMVDYWQMTQTPKLDDYLLLPREAEVPVSR